MSNLIVFKPSLDNLSRETFAPNNQGIRFNEYEVLYDRAGAPDDFVVRAVVDGARNTPRFVQAAFARELFSAELDVYVPAEDGTLRPYLRIGSGECYLTGFESRAVAAATPELVIFIKHRKVVISMHDFPGSAEMTFGT